LKPHILIELIFFFSKNLGLIRAIKPTAVIQLYFLNTADDY